MFVFVSNSRSLTFYTRNCRGRLMERSSAEFYWVVLPAVGLLLARFLAEWRLRRRLKSYGDPQVLGISMRWAPRAVGAVLFALGLAATTGILVTPASSDDDEPSSPGTILILLDAQSLLESQDEEILVNETLEQAAQEVLEEGRGLRFAVYMSGEKPRPVVPDTVDGQGILVMMGGLQPDRGPVGSGSLRSSIETLFTRRHDDKVRMTLIVITGRSAEAVAKELPRSARLNARVMVLRLPGRGLQREFGTSGSGGAWNWSEDRRELRRFLTERQPEVVPAREWRRQLVSVPYLAGLALALAAVECVLVLVVPLHFRS